MCDPATLTGLALTAGSTVVNTIANNKAADAREDVLAAERIRQGSLDREADALNTQSQDRFENTEGKQEAKARDLSDFFTGPSTAGEANDAAAAVMPSDTSGITVREMQKQTGAARDFTGRQAASLAGLRSFGDMMGDNARMQARDAGLIGQVGGFKRGSSGVTPLELDEASQKGAGLRVFGDLLGGAGSIATNYGMTRGGASPIFGAKAATTRSGTSLAPASSRVPLRRPNGVSLYPTSRSIG